MATPGDAQGKLERAFVVKGGIVFFGFVDSYFGSRATVSLGINQISILLVLGLVVGVCAKGNVGLAGRIAVRHEQGECG